MTICCNNNFILLIKILYEAGISLLPVYVRTRYLLIYNYQYATILPVTTYIHN